MHFTLSSATLLVLGALPAFGQGQPNARESRHVGLDVLATVGSPALDTLLPGGITLTVHAPAGTTYDLILDGNLTALDYSLPYAPLIGPLISPFGPATPSNAGTFYFDYPQPTHPAPAPGSVNAVIPIGLGFTDPAGGTPGLIPAGATSQTLVSTFTLAAGGLANLQAAILDGGGAPPTASSPVYMTDGQQRTIIQPPSTLASSGFSLTKHASLGGFLRDSEQGDIDGDGDLDEVLVGSPTNGWTFGVIQSAGATPTRTLLPVSPSSATALGRTTTSAELVDLNNDGYLDLVVGARGSFPLANFQVLLNGGAGGAGGLLGGGAAPITFDPALSGTPMSISDVETGDFNDDGWIDVYATCYGGDCGTGQVNRLFFGGTNAAGYVLTEVTSTQTEIPLDNSKDCEVFDYEGDGDLDIVVANAGGGVGATFGPSVNLIHINDGTGRFSTTSVPGPELESFDVLAVDIDRNGLDDLYFGNFVEVSNTCTYGAILPDQLLLNGYQSGNPALGGVLSDVSSLIPDNNWASVDVEGVAMPSGEFVASGVSTRDFDGDGDVDIFIGLGSFGTAAAALATPTAGINRGLVILQNQQVDNGGGPGAPISFSLGDSAFTEDDITDLEFGDWFNPLAPLGRWFEKDLGVSTFNGGQWVYTKNP